MCAGDEGADRRYQTVEDEPDDPDIGQRHDDVGEARAVPRIPDEKADANAAGEHFSGDDGEPGEADTDPEAGENVGAAAGIMILKKNSAWLSWQDLGHVAIVLRMLRTPTAVLISTGQTEVMKITKMAEGAASMNAASDSGSHASGGTVRRIWKIGSSPRIAQIDWPISAPTQTPTTAPGQSRSRHAAAMSAPAGPGRCRPGHS